MVRRLRLPGLILVLTLLAVPACGSDTKPGDKGSATPPAEKGPQPGNDRAG
jgi:hypothetical protein